MMLPSIMDVAALAVTAFSPSKTCRVRVSSTRYRNDPYRARVMNRPAEVPLAAPIMVAPFNHVAALASAAFAPVTFIAPVPTTMEVVAAPPAVTQSAAKDAPAAHTKAHYARIGFKHETMMFQAPFRVSAGDVVIVEADRGEHIGVVQEVTTVAPNFNVPCRVLRRATPAEFRTHEALKAKEAAVSKSIQKLSESLGLGIKIVDTEFQLDSNKLTVFFSSKIFVDFRKLQRSLFRDYRCRIWLVNWAEVRPYTPAPINAVI